MSDPMPDTQAYAVIHPDGRVTEDVNGPPIGVVVPSSAFRGCMILCLDVKLVKRLRGDAT